MTDEPYEQTNARAQLAHEDDIKLCEEKGWKAQPISREPTQHWAVEVRVNGDGILTIESNYLAGVPNIDAYEDDIRTCANHLLAFIGDGRSAILTSDASAIEGARAEALAPFDNLVSHLTPANGWAASDSLEIHTEDGRLLYRLSVKDIWRARDAVAAIRSRTPVTAEADKGFDMRAFSRENLARCTAPNGFNHALDSWTLSDWMTAVLGELGEASNVLKKLNRVRDGIPGNDKTPEQLRSDFADELADTFIYLDLLAQASGVDLPTAIRSKFDRTSKKVGYVAAPPSISSEGV